MNGILCSDSSRFEIIISDNASEDNTQEILSRIKDPRLKYYRNDKNLGPAKNWQLALELGNGEYLFLVMSRDRIRGENIPKLIDILEFSRANNITCLMDGYTYKNEIMIYEGIDAMIKFLSFNHPTGSIFSRKIFHEIPNLEHYFMSSDAYPENYLRRDMLLKGKGAFIMSRVFNYPDLLIDFAKVRSSSTFEDNIFNAIFGPRRRTKLFFEIIDMIEPEIPGVFTQSEINKCFRIKFTELLHAIGGWRAWCANPVSTAHYGHNTRHVSLSETLGNIFNAYHETLKHLREKGTFTLSKQLIMLYCLIKLFTYDTAKKCAKGIRKILHNLKH